MEISQLTAAISKEGDSINNYVYEIRKLLIENGFNSNIYVEHGSNLFGGYIKHYSECKPKNEDIVILHATIGSSLTNFFENLRCKKIIIFNNFTPAKFFEDFDKEKVSLLKNYRLDLKSLISYTNRVLTTSYFNKKDLEDIGFNNIDVIPIFIDFDRFNKFDNEIIKKFDDDFVNLIHVGRIVPNKKIEDIIKIFYYYKKYINQKSRLFLIGSRNHALVYYEKILSYITKLNLDDVYFTNCIDDSELTSYYKISDIFLCMSEHEGVGLPLIESMYFKIPIIAFNSTAIPYTLGNSGILINDKCPRKTAELIEIINKNKDLNNKIIKSQLERLKQFESKKLKEKFLDYILNLKNSYKRFDENSINLIEDKQNNHNLISNHPKSIDKIKILYIQPRGVGDIIMSTPIIKNLKKKYPYALIDFAGEDYCKDIIVNNPNINEFYSFNRLPDLQGYILVLRPYLKTQYMPDWQNMNIHIVDLYALLCGIKLEDYKTEIVPLKINLKDFGIEDNEDYICLHTESSSKYKNWPYFKELIEKLKDDFKIVVIDEQQHNYKHVINLPNNIKLREKAYIVSKSKMLIGIDSMGIHISSAFNIPTIAIYGNTLPELCKPLSNNYLITIQPEKRCTVGWHHICKEENYCINNISVEEVLKKIDELMLKCKIY